MLQKDANKHWIECKGDRVFGKENGQMYANDSNTGSKHEENNTSVVQQI